jgi:hypothetical protein
VARRVCWRATAVQLGADPAHAAGIFRRQFEGGLHRLRALHEELHALIAQEDAQPRGAPRRQVARLRYRERGNGPRHLPRDAEGLPAGGEHAGAGAVVQDALDQVCGRLHQVLAVVEHQQGAGRAETVRNAFRQAAPRLFADAQHRREMLRDQPAVSEGIEGDEPDAAGVLRRHLGGDGERQPRLADPACPHERHQPAPPQLKGHVGPLILPADQRGEGRREIDRVTR